MIIVDPYSTSYGRLLNKDRITKELTKFLITTQHRNLNYEFSNGENNDIFYIIGLDQNEQDLPIFNQPMVFTDMKNFIHIAVDLRKYVKPVKEQPLNLEEIYKDAASCKFLINSSLIMSDFLGENYGDYKKVTVSVTMAYAILVSHIVDMIIKLNPLEKYDVEIAAAYFANLLLIPSLKIEEYRDAIIARLSNARFSLPANKKHIASVIENLEQNEINYSIDGLIRIIQSVLPEEKSDLLNESIFLNMLSNLWFGPGTNETIVMALESMPLWIALVYCCVDDVTYKRSKLSTIFDKYSKNIDSKEFVKSMELIIKNKTRRM